MKCLSNMKKKNFIEKDNLALFMSILKTLIKSQTQDMCVLSTIS